MLRQERNLPSFRHTYQRRHPLDITFKLTLEGLEGASPAKSQGEGIPVRGNRKSKVSSRLERPWPVERSAA